MLVFLVRFVATFCLLHLATTLVTTGLDVWQNRYLELGYWRSIALALRMHAFRTLPAVLSFISLIFVASGWGRRRRWPAARGPAFGIGAGVALLLLLRVGYAYNRYHTDVNWSWRRSWHGLQVPGFLWETEVLWKNGAFVAGAILLALAIGCALAFLLRRAPRLARAALSASGSKIVASVAAGLLGVAFLLGTLARSTSSTRPSFLVICLDTLRADHIGAYGYPKPTTPAIDALAAESVRFEWTISQAEATLPSHVSLFTSELPSSHGVWNHHDVLAPERLTLAELLREAGYRTAAFVDAGHLLGLFGFTQGFDVYHDRYKHLRGSVELATRWLDHRHDPFFLFVHGYDIHTPYAPWSTYRKDFVDPSYEGRFEPDVKTVTDLTWKKKENAAFQIPLTDADIRHMIACYDAAIRWSDDQVRALLDDLERQGLLRSTWVILLSDHGEEFTEHGSFLHEKLYQTITHVPLLVRPPDGPMGDAYRSRRGSVVTTVSALIDVFPTIAELAGLDRPRTAEGLSLVPALRGSSSDPGKEGGVSDPARCVYSQTFQYGHQRAATQGSLHLITSEARPDSLELYDFRADPLEQTPTIVALGDSTSRHDGPYGPEARQLTARVLGWMEATRGGMRGNEARRLLGSDFKTLKNLGYIQ